MNSGKSYCSKSFGFGRGGAPRISFGAERSEFDPGTMEERPFDIERAKRVFLEANSTLKR
jgi:hypothetical protein